MILAFIFAATRSAAVSCSCMTTISMVSLGVTVNSCWPENRFMSGVRMTGFPPTISGTSGMNGKGFPSNRPQTVASALVRAVQMMRAV